MGSILGYCRRQLCLVLVRRKSQEEGRSADHGCSQWVTMGPTMVVGEPHQLRMPSLLASSVSAVHSNMRRLIALLAPSFLSATGGLRPR